MARSRGFASATRRGPRRRTAWGIGPQTGADGSPQAVSASSSVLAAGGASATLEAITLVRLRGELQIHLLGAALLTNGFHGAFGIGIVKTPAFTAGIVSMPTPLIDEDDEGWLYHRYFSLISGGPIAAATAATQEDQVNSTSAALRVEVDSKAMRKLDVGDTIFAAIEVIEINLADLSWSFNSRTLVKLP